MVVSSFYSHSCVMERHGSHLGRDKEVYFAYKSVDQELEQLQDYNFMSLKEACDKLNKEKYNRFGYSIDGIMVEQSDVNTHYSRLTKYFVEVDTIYGKSPSAFVEWRTIDKAKFTSGKVKMEQGELVLYSAGTNADKTTEYIGLAIQKDNLSKDIDKIMLDLYIPLREVMQKFYDECENDPILSPIIAYVEVKLLSHNGLLNILAFYLTYKYFLPVYGRNIQSDKLMPIHIDQINGMYFDNEGSSLYSYRDRVKKYTDLYIKKDSFWEFASEVFKQELNEITGYSKHSKP